MRLSVIIPCYNEKDSLPELISLVKDIPFEDKEIILVDDGSDDGTSELIKTEFENQIDKAIYHKSNLGKGAAIRSAIEHITGDLVVIQDADLEYDPRDYVKLIEPILSGDADVVYGSRFKNQRAKGFRRRNFIANMLLTKLSNLFTGLDLTDMETCYKLFKADVIKGIEIEQKGFGFEPEITAKIANKGFRVREVAISYNGRSHGEGKKITWKDGIKAVCYIIKYAL